MFASAVPESVIDQLNKIYLGRPMSIKSRKELLATIRPNQRVFLQSDTGDMPEMPQPVAVAAGSAVV